MESEVSVQLAADILQDQFGEVVAKVGTVLLERGELTRQDILRFHAQGLRSGRCSLLAEEEPLGPPSVRNALLVLLQHGLASHRPHPQAKGRGQQAETGGGARLYSLDIEEVLARLRFPQFLEYTYFVYGVPAFHLMNVLFRHGRACMSFAIAEARRYSQEDQHGLDAEDLERMIRRLVEDKLLAEVQPCSGGAGFSVEAAGDEPASKRPRGPGGGDGGGEDPGGQLVPLAYGSVARETVYRYGRHAYNLCLSKNLLCRLVEDRLGPEHAALLEVLGKAVSPSESGEAASQYKTLAEVEAELRLTEHNLEGEGLRRKLDLLSANAESLLVKRMGRRGAPLAAADPRAAKRARAGEGAAAAAPDFEYAVEWTQACRQLRLAATSQVIREQFGPIGLRMFNLLTSRHPPQKMEDRDIFSCCMVPEAEGRALLHKMVAHGVVDTQEVPRSETSSFKANFWLYYVDMRRLQLAILDIVIQAILNLRVRFRVENAKVAPLESRAASLTARERTTLREGRRKEDVLERSYLVLDAAVLVLRSG